LALPIARLPGDDRTRVVGPIAVGGRAELEHDHVVLLDHARPGAEVLPARRRLRPRPDRGVAADDAGPFVAVALGADGRADRATLETVLPSELAEQAHDLGARPRAVEADGRKRAQVARPVLACLRRLVLGDQKRGPTLARADDDAQAPDLYPPPRRKEHVL